MGCPRKNCGFYTLVSVGPCLVVLGLALALYWGSLYNNILTNQLVLANNSKSYNLWKETPIPMYFSVYFFNWTNADEVIETKWGVKPKLEERGPYVFSEHHIRENLTWSDDLQHVTYQQRRIWKFVPELSNGSLDDKITSVNPIVATIGNKIKGMNIVIQQLVNVALRGLEHSIILTKTVNESMFTGYDDSILKIIAKLKIKNFDMPSKFSWFYGKNDSATDCGFLTINTGKRELNRTGMLELWNGLSYTNDYEGICSYVNGSFGELFPPSQDYQQISIFLTDICSTLTVDYKDDQVLKEIKGRRYVATNYLFDNGTKYPDRACFHGSRVVPSGVRDISKCRYDAPAFISYPHFYLADPIYGEGVIGLHPNKSEHETYVLLEPSTGIPLNIHAQVQINLFLEPIKHMSMFDDIKPTYVPIMWFRQSVVLTEEFASMVRMIVILSTLGLYIGWAAFGIGMLCLIYIFYSICRYYFCKREKYLDTEILINDDDNE